MTEYAQFDDDPGTPYQAKRRALARVMVPAAIASITAVGLGLVPALASDGAPSLPQLTAEQLVAKALGNDTRALSGTVQVSTDLGIPQQALAMLGQVGGPAAAVTGQAGAAGGSGQAKAAEANPTAPLTQLLAGDHTLRVSADGPDRTRIALVEPMAEYDLIHNGDQAWAWDSQANQAIHLSGDHRQGAEGTGHAGQQKPSDIPATPQEAAKRLLADNSADSDITVAGTTTVAGRSAYQLSVKPKQSGSTIGEIRIAVDSATGTPLAVVATSTSGSKVLDMHFSSVSFAAPAASTFDFTPPKGAKVVEQSAKDAKDATKKADDQQRELNKADAPQVIGTGWTSVVSVKLPSGAMAEGAGDAVQGTAQGRKGRHQAQGLGDPMTLLKSLGKPVAGGTEISTKVVNVLITDDGRVFAGAVTLPVLQNAAGVK